MQAVARCAPSSANFVFEWSKPDSSFHDFVVWHASHPASRTVSPCQLHALPELSFVRIVVATRASQSLPVINSRRLRLELADSL